MLPYVLFFQLHIYQCLTFFFFLKKKNDKLEHAILQTNYYLLPLDLQRDFKFMINIVQKAKFLKTGGTKLDVTLFVLVGKI